MRKYTKHIQGGSQLRDKARSKRFAQSKRKCIVYNCSPMLRLGPVYQVGILRHKLFHGLLTQNKILHPAEKMSKQNIKLGTKKTE